MSGKGERDRPLAVVLAGPTASGKTGAALIMAEAMGTTIIGADSRQIYRRLDIGTAKPTAAQRARVKHHLVDVVEPDEPYNVGRYRSEVNALLSAGGDGVPKPFFVGGTGLYLKAVLDGLCPAPAGDRDLRSWLGKAALFPAGGLHDLLLRIDPESAARIHPNDSQRLTRALEVYYLTGETLSARQDRHRSGERPFTSAVIIIERDREELKERIAQRLEEMMAAGFPEEVRSLLADGLDPALPALRAVGYPQMISHLQGRLGLPETLEEIRRATWQYARRQLTWFRSVKNAQWITAARGESDADLAGKALDFLKSAGVAKVRG